MPGGVCNKAWSTIGCGLLLLIAMAWPSHVRAKEIPVVTISKGIPDKTVDASDPFTLAFDGLKGTKLTIIGLRNRNAVWGINHLDGPEGTPRRPGCDRLEGLLRENNLWNIGAASPRTNTTVPLRALLARSGLDKLQKDVEDAKAALKTAKIQAKGITDTVTKAFEKFERARDAWASVQSRQDRAAAVLARVDVKDGKATALIDDPSFFVEGAVYCTFAVIERKEVVPLKSITEFAEVVLSGDSPPLPGSEERQCLWRGLVGKAIRDEGALNAQLSECGTRPQRLFSLPPGFTLDDTAVSALDGALDEFSDRRDQVETTKAAPKSAIQDLKVQKYDLIRAWAIGLLGGAPVSKGDPEFKPIADLLVRAGQLQAPPTSGSGRFLDPGLRVLVDGRYVYKVATSIQRTGLPRLPRVTVGLESRLTQVLDVDFADLLLPGTQVSLLDALLWVNQTIRFDKHEVKLADLSVTGSPAWAAFQAPWEEQQYDTFAGMTRPAARQAIIGQLKRVTAAWKGWDKRAYAQPLDSMVSDALRLVDALEDLDAALKVAEEFDYDRLAVQKTLKVPERYRLSTIDTLTDRQTSFVSQFVTSTVGFAGILLDPALGFTMVPIVTANIYLFPNPVNEPMWSRGGDADARRIFSIAVGGKVDPTDPAAGLEATGRYTGLGPNRAVNPVLVGANLQLIPYVTLSGGVAIVGYRPGGLDSEEVQTVGRFYLGATLETNVIDLARWFAKK